MRGSSHREQAEFVWSQQTLDTQQGIHNYVFSNTCCLYCVGVSLSNGKIILFFSFWFVMVKKRKKKNMSKQKITSPKRSQPQLLITFAVLQSSDACQAWSKRRERGQREGFFFSLLTIWKQLHEKGAWCKTGCRSMWKKYASLYAFLTRLLTF